MGLWSSPAFGMWISIESFDTPQPNFIDIFFNTQIGICCYIGEIVLGKMMSFCAYTFYCGSDFRSVCSFGLDNLVFHLVVSTFFKQNQLFQLKYTL